MKQPPEIDESLRFTERYDESIGEKPVPHAMPAATDHPPLPTRLGSLVFLFKSRGLQAKRAFRNFREHVPKHPQAGKWAQTPVLTELKSELWNQTSSAEFTLKAGKIQNLRVAARLLDGIEIPAGGIFSFWRQIGRTTKGKGYTTGRELRSGCLIPNVGGGLCALSGMLYEAALATGCEILERHGHSRILAGMTADPKRDATIFWNYVDLRFRVPSNIRIEAKLDTTHLIVRFRSDGTAAPASHGEREAAKPAAHTTGDCTTCGQSSCFRHAAANPPKAQTEGQTAFLLDAFTPEFNTWCAANAGNRAQWLLPLDHKRWRKPNYAWTPPPGTKPVFATLQTLLRARKARTLPKQGPVRQRALLEADHHLAKYYADRIPPCTTHLVVTQNLLPHLHELGALGGRTYDVLLHRLPFHQLHEVLDEAAALHPSSKTLTDFRADPALVESEQHALAGATRFITPHRDLARRMGKRTVLVDWKMPEPIPLSDEPSPAHRVFLPCSALARKGAYELGEALRGVTCKLLVLGGATEDGDDPLRKVQHRQSSLEELAACEILILPAWVEHQPRLALLALASGIPVIATRACGLAPHPLLDEIDKPDASSIHAVLEKRLAERSESLAGSGRL